MRTIETANENIDWTLSWLIVKYLSQKNRTILIFLTQYKHQHQQQQQKNHLNKWLATLRAAYSKKK